MRHQDGTDDAEPILHYLKQFIKERDTPRIPVGYASEKDGRAGEEQRGGISDSDRHRR